MSQGLVCSHSTEHRLCLGHCEHARWKTQCGDGRIRPENGRQLRRNRCVKTASGTRPWFDLQLRYGVREGSLAQTAVHLVGQPRFVAQHDDQRLLFRWGADNLRVLARCRDTSSRCIRTSAVTASSGNGRKSSTQVGVITSRV